MNPTQLNGKTTGKGERKKERGVVSFVSFVMDDMDEKKSPYMLS
jgi:hypothetical protein